MTNESKLIQENIKLFVLYQSLEKMTYFPSIKLKQTMDAGGTPAEIESSLYYILKLTTEILKSYMQDNGIPIYEDNSFENNREQAKNELLAHSDFSFGLAELIRLYQILNDDQLGKIDPDFIGTPSEHPLNNYRSSTAYNHAVYSSAYWNSCRSHNPDSEKEYFSRHPFENPNEYFTFI